MEIGFQCSKIPQQVGSHTLQSYRLTHFFDSLHLNNNTWQSIALRTLVQPPSCTQNRTNEQTKAGMIERS